MTQLSFDGTLKGVGAGKPAGETPAGGSVSWEQANNSYRSGELTKIIAECTMCRTAHNDWMKANAIARRNMHRWISTAHKREQHGQL